MPPPVLDVRALSVQFETNEGPLRVLRDVSLQVAPGETFGLAGASRAALSSSRAATSWA